MLKFRKSYSIDTDSVDSENNNEGDTTYFDIIMRQKMMVTKKIMTLIRFRKCYSIDTDSADSENNNAGDTTYFEVTMGQKMMVTKRIMIQTRFRKCYPSDMDSVDSENANEGGNTYDPERDNGEYSEDDGRRSRKRLHNDSVDGDDDDRSIRQ